MLMKTQKTWCIAGRNTKWLQTSGKEYSSFLKLNICLPYDPEIKPLGIYPREVKICGHMKTCTLMYIAALCAIAKHWKQTKCSLSESLNKLIHSCYRILLSTKGKEILAHVITWVHIKEIKLNIKSQSQKVAYHIIPVL